MTEGACSVTTAPYATGNLRGTVKKGWRWGKKLKSQQGCGGTTHTNLGKRNIFRTALFGRVLVLPIVYV